MPKSLCSFCFLLSISLLPKDGPKDSLVAYPDLPQGRRPLDLAKWIDRKSPW